MEPYEQRFDKFTDSIDGTRWKIDVGFTDSNWSCIWGQGCEGILDHCAAELNQGCCSVGAHLIDDEEAMLIAALGMSLDPQGFQNHDSAAELGVLAGGEQHATRVVNNACIFHNEPGFAGGEGCALHIGAVAAGESPIDWKPSICWQAPLKVDVHADGSKTLRPWTKADWGPEEEIAWCCSERNEHGATAYVGDTSVAASLHAELTGLVGPEIAVELRKRVEK
jgi:hypothetical protein